MYFLTLSIFIFLGWRLHSHSGYVCRTKEHKRSHWLFKQWATVSIVSQSFIYLTTSLIILSLSL